MHAFGESQMSNSVRQHHGKDCFGKQADKFKTKKKE